MTKNDEQRIEELINKRLREREDAMVRMDEMQWLHYKRMKAEKRLKASRKRLTNTYNILRQKEQPTSLWGKTLYWVERGLNIAQGATIGYKVGDAINIIMGIRKMMKKR
ncbi:MAG: hypothetical protein KBT39_09550 [Bacteroidales bacterium]|nr:hypothetical protein [Bacteroidales bacterium]